MPSFRGADARKDTHAHGRFLGEVHVTSTSCLTVIVSVWRPRSSALLSVCVDPAPVMVFVNSTSSQLGSPFLVPPRRSQSFLLPIRSPDSSLEGCELEMLYLGVEFNDFRVRTEDKKRRNSPANAGKQAQKIPIKGSTDDHMKTGAIVQVGSLECVLASSVTIRTTLATQTLIKIWVLARIWFPLGVGEKGFGCGWKGEECS